MRDRSLAASTGDLQGGALFVDVLPFAFDRKSVITESKDGKSVLKIGGQFQRANVPNVNKRIYTPGILREAVSSLQKDIKERGVLGELEHPQDAKIHLDRVSHVITKVWMEGDVVFGECEVLEKTTQGKQLKALVESGVRVGISSRGIGELRPIMHEGQEYMAVAPGYTIITWDIVAQPSVVGSYMNITEDIINVGDVAVQQYKQNRMKQLKDSIDEFLKI